MKKIVIIQILIALFQSSLLPQNNSGLFFSHQRGFYTKPFDLKISCSIEKGMIHYTFDGSDPLSSNTVLSGISPVTVTIDPARMVPGRGLTPGFVVRAVVLKDEIKQTDVITHSYIFINAVPLQIDPGKPWPDPVSYTHLTLPTTPYV